MELLYEGEKLRIGYNPNSHEDHILYIGLEGTDNERMVHIQRGILEELAETQEIFKIERKINRSNPNILYILKEHKIPFEELALAFAQARIAELEEERDYFISESRKYREEVEELKAK